MQLNYSLLAYLLLAVASAVPNQNIDHRAVGDILAARASTNGSAAPTRASAATANNTVRVVPMFDARAAAVLARVSATAKTSAVAKGSVAPEKKPIRAWPAAQ